MFNSYARLEPLRAKPFIFHRFSPLHSCDFEGANRIQVWALFMRNTRLFTSVPSMSIAGLQLYVSVQPSETADRAESTCINCYFRKSCYTALQCICVKCTPQTCLFCQNGGQEIPHNLGCVQIKVEEFRLANRPFRALNAFYSQRAFNGGNQRPAWSAPSMALDVTQAPRTEAHTGLCNTVRDCGKSLKPKAQVGSLARLLRW